MASQKMADSGKTKSSGVCSIIKIYLLYATAVGSTNKRQEDSTQTLIREKADI